MTERLIFGLVLDGHYHWGGGIDIEWYMHKHGAGSPVRAALKHKRLWDVGLGVRLGYGGDTVFPYTLLGLRVCIDCADLTGVKNAADKWWNGAYVPEMLWEWGVGLEVPSPEGWFMGVEVAMGNSLLWAVASGGGISDTALSVRLRGGHHF